MTGRIVRLQERLGFGFLVTDDALDAPEVFFHANDCDCLFPAHLRVGQRVTFEHGTNRSGRPLARHVKPIVATMAQISK